MPPQTKAGISWPVQEGTSDPIAKFFQDGSKLSWHWNWNKNWKEVLSEISDELELDAEFVPTIFAPDHLYNGSELQEGHQIIMGFNEPDHDDANVACRCDPADAAAAWEELAQFRSEDNGVKLVAPAVAHNIEWLKEFLSLIPEETRPDYINVHVYTTTFEDFVQRVETFHEEFQLPIIVSEFAMQSFDPNVPGPENMQQVHDFMGQTTKWLDETDYIVKFSWFGAVRNETHLHGVHPFNRLMNEHGELTNLGHQYVGGGHE